MEIQFTVISIFSLRKNCTYNFATTTLVLLPGHASGSKSLLLPKKNEFLGLIHVYVCLCVCLHDGLCDIKFYINWLNLRTNVAILDITFILIIVNQI